ncbi:zinc finger and BTB domain-containing protein 49-like [Corythoichthys intestinalis]|uniref:zinc finger and BTB domain-containing protein 49-like n=1 Tax=Corythoichthys intestinalis TaxID=161448 RepID=UPI0025A60554|nr:zinc finger and BTB domain-containing protein 49-like [Corythoichthys intestinalis]
MCKVGLLRTLVTQRLNVAVDEIFKLFEKTVGEYEEELCRKEKNERRLRKQLEQLEAALNPRVILHREDVKKVLPQSLLKQREEPAEPPFNQDEDDNKWSSQNGHQLHPSQSEEKLNPDVTTEDNREQWDGPPEDYVALLSDTDDLMECGFTVEQDELEEPPRIQNKEENVHYSQSEEKLSPHKTAENNRKQQERYIAPLLDSDELAQHVKDKQEDMCISQNGDQHLPSQSEKLSPHITTEDNREQWDGPPEGYIAPLSDTDELMECGSTVDQDELEEPPRMKNEEENLRKSQNGEKLHDSQSEEKLSPHKTAENNQEKQDGSPEGYIAPLSDSDELEEPPDDKQLQGLMEEPTLNGVNDGQSSQLHSPSPTSSSSQNYNFTACLLCMKPFASPANLISHMKIHHGDMETPSVSSREAHARGKRFACSACRKCFSSKRCFNQHRLIHLKEKGLSRQLRPGKFKDRLDLMEDLSAHLAGKFSCSLCGTRFRKKYQMVYHLENSCQERNLPNPDRNEPK